MSTLLRGISTPNVFIRPITPNDHKIVILDRLDLVLSPHLLQLLHEMPTKWLSPKSNHFAHGKRQCNEQNVALHRI